MRNTFMVMKFVSFSCLSEILGSTDSSDVSVVALFIDCSWADTMKPSQLLSNGPRREKTGLRL